VHAVAQLAEALRDKPEGLRFDSRSAHWDFSFYVILWHWGQLIFS
jgi:hypothetical protein